MVCILDVPGLNSGQGLAVSTEAFVVVLSSPRQMPGKFVRPEPLISTLSVLHYSPYHLMAYRLSCCECS